MGPPSILHLLQARELGPASAGFPGRCTASLGAWAEADFVSNACSAQYATLVPRPRSTIASAFCSDGQTIASTHGDHTVKIVSCSTGETLSVLRGHQRTPWVVRFNPAKARVLASGSLDHLVIVWEAGVARVLTSHNFGKPIASVAFHSHGDIMAVAAGHRVYSWIYSKPGSPTAPVAILRTRKSLRAVHFHPLGRPLMLTAEVVERKASPPAGFEAAAAGLPGTPASLASPATQPAQQQPGEVGAERAPTAIPPYLQPTLSRPTSGPGAAEATTPQATAVSSPILQGVHGVDGPAGPAVAAAGPLLDALQQAEVVRQTAVLEHLSQLVQAANQAPSRKEHDKAVCQLLLQRHEVLQPGAATLQLQRARAQVDGVWSAPQPQPVSSAAMGEQAGQAPSGHAHPQVSNTTAAGGGLASPAASSLPTPHAGRNGYAAPPACIGEQLPGMHTTACPHTVPPSASASPASPGHVQMQRSQQPQQFAAVQAGPAMQEDQPRTRTPQRHSWLARGWFSSWHQHPQQPQQQQPQQQLAPHDATYTPATQPAGAHAHALPQIRADVDMTPSVHVPQGGTQAGGDPHRPTAGQQGAGAAAVAAAGTQSTMGAPNSALEAGRSQGPDARCSGSGSGSRLIPLLPQAPCGVQPARDTFSLHWGWETSAQAAEEAELSVREHRALPLERQFPVPGLPEQPCVVNLVLWPFSRRHPERSLAEPLLQLPRTILCSEMGTCFSACGRYLACCVATDTPSAACEAWVRAQQGQEAEPATAGRAQTSDGAAQTAPAACIGEASPAGIDKAAMGSGGSAGGGPCFKAVDGQHASTQQGCPCPSDMVVDTAGRRTSAGLGSCAAPAVAPTCSSRAAPGSSDSNRSSSCCAVATAEACGAAGGCDNAAMEDGALVDSHAQHNGTFPAITAPSHGAAAVCAHQPSQCGVTPAYLGSPAARLAQFSLRDAQPGFVVPSPLLAQQQQQAGQQQQQMQMQLGQADGTPVGMPGQQAAVNHQLHKLWAAWHGPSTAQSASTAPLAAGAGSRGHSTAGAAPAPSMGNAAAPNPQHAAVADAAGMAAHVPGSASPAGSSCTYELRVYSLDGPTFGQVLHARPIRAAHCLTSLQFSPTSQHLLVAYGRRHISLCSLLWEPQAAQLTPVHTVVEIYRVEGMQLLRQVAVLQDEVNVAAWHPSPGGGILYGTKDGRLRLFRHDRREPERPALPTQART